MHSLLPITIKTLWTKCGLAGNAISPVVSSKLPARRNTHGFTIVELLIVIVVIGILAAITIVAFNGVQQRARDSQRQSAINQFKKSLAIYKADKGVYPYTYITSQPQGVNDPSGDWPVANLNGVTRQMIIAPGAAAGTTNSFTQNAVTNGSQYQFRALNDDNSVCFVIGTHTCTKYLVAWWSESKNAVQSETVSQ
ncbi:MAG: hypothetical protein UY35_C0003G0013 [Candidatus Saccharibacteria bacterium GW2011_GWC2_48_9]|nr:MAG: hypothetical protein UY35_C0003G0013 [Candidatus Saccharibacteria bacterium GW2011_GWC2_48_9]HCH34158.1 hypothetical protein [Candidatus Saccharibacteria bacterium]